MGRFRTLVRMPASRVPSPPLLHAGLRSALEALLEPWSDEVEWFSLAEDGVDLLPDAFGWRETSAGGALVPRRGGSSPIARARSARGVRPTWAVLDEEGRFWRAVERSPRQEGDSSGTGYFEPDEFRRLFLDGRPLDSLLVVLSCRG